jgi:hypothetical protein
MPQHYPWRRFWYPRSADFRLTDRGYLIDPEGEHGRLLNPEAVSLDGLYSVPCLVLLGEPGIGKTTALREADATLKFDLGAYQTDTSLTEEVFRNPEVQAWSRGTHPLSLSFDGLDEGRVAIANIVKVLLRELTKFKDNTHRLAVRIGCRTADWPSSLDRFSAPSPLLLPS